MDKFLIDTHALLWYLDANPLLSGKAKATIEDLEVTPFVSHITLWEIAIKVSIGKLNLQIAFEELETKLIHDGFLILPITTNHIITYSNLPLHHRDPFDRLLIAQTIVEGFTIIGKDEIFDTYTVKRLW